MSAETQEHIKRVVSEATPISDEQLAAIRTIFKSSARHLRDLKERGVCRWNDCGGPILGWAIEQVDGAVPVCQSCVDEHNLTLGEIRA